MCEQDVDIGYIDEGLLISYRLAEALDKAVLGC